MIVAGVILIISAIITLAVTVTIQARELRQLAEDNDQLIGELFNAHERIDLLTVELEAFTP